MKGGGGGRTLPHPPPTLLLAPYLAQSLTLVPHSLLETAQKCLLCRLYTCTLINMVFTCLGTIVTILVHTTNNTGTYY